jgi:subtilisin family serine protease
VDDIHGYNFISGSKTTDPMDDNKHGSHCAGTIGASGNDGLGIVGVNWNVSMMALKFLDASGSGGAEDATKAILYAIKMHVNVLSNSWGGFGESKTILEAVKKANEAGIIFIAAAGNDSVNIDDYKFFPAGFDVANVLPVAAIDNQGVLAYFSNWSDKLAMIGAPGKDIYSTTLDGLGYLSGTSMATPHVAGVAALVLAQYPNLSVKELVARLTLTAQPIEGLYRKTKYGLVNAYSALTNTLSPQPSFDPHYWNHKSTVIETPHPYKNNSNLEWTISIPEAKEIAIYFDKIDVEAERDAVVIRKTNGDYIEFVKSQAKNYYSMNIKDNNVKVVFTSSPGTRQYGFKISHVAWR